MNALSHISTVKESNGFKLYLENYKLNDSCRELVNVKRPQNERNN